MNGIERKNETFFEKERLPNPVICAIFTFYLYNCAKYLYFIGPYALLFVSNRRLRPLFSNFRTFARITHHITLYTTPSHLFTTPSTMAHHLYPPVQWSEDELARVVTPSPEDTLVMVIITFFI
jgi:hypothetical protein